MADVRQPRYPVYVPSKGRSESAKTARCLLSGDVPFHLVVEPQEQAIYEGLFGADRVLVLPKNNGGLIFARNWIKEHATAAGAVRHWQLDDNINQFRRFHGGQRINCHPGVALAVCEDFTDRYENVAISGLNYTMFAIGSIPPFYVNVHVYSCTLVLNSIPQRWRSAYNDDTDMCLQVLAAGWCTVLINAFLAEKMATMVVKGGNTDALYRGDGRLRMARALERLRPGVVTTGRRFKRPQHIVKYAWQMFDTPLRPRADVEVPGERDEYGLRLQEVKPLESPTLRAFAERFNGGGDE